MYFVLHHILSPFDAVVYFSRINSAIPLFASVIVPTIVLATVAVIAPYGARYSQRVLITVHSSITSSLHPQMLVVILLPLLGISPIIGKVILCHSNSVFVYLAAP